MEYLAESEHYKVMSEWESVELHFKNSERRPAQIGDFYGDPAGAFISRTEKYIVMFGCGIIIYRIQEPFTDYNYNTPNLQYAEFHRYPGDIWWVESAYECTSDDGDADDLNNPLFRFVMYNDDGKVGVYRMNIDTHEVQLLE